MFVDNDRGRRSKDMTAPVVGAPRSAASTFYLFERAQNGPESRADTDNLLSYYESPLADKGLVSSSSYSSSSDSSCSQYSKESPVASPRRTEDTAVRQHMPVNRSQSDAHDITPSSSMPDTDVTFSPENPASYLNYQPGLHATAGPLPPPPRLDPPPRSSRRRADIEAVKQALQLPPSVSAALSKRAAASSHRREGASDSEPSPDVVIQPPPRNDSLPEDREWVSVTPPPSKKRVSAELSISSGEDLPPTPSPPPKSLRNSLTRGLRRISLPRSSPSRTPSPPQLSPRPPQIKIKDLYPSAMYCSEFSPNLTTLERCALYTTKINELALYDCGLTDWLFEARLRNASPVFTPKLRNASHGSNGSEATFPLRPDASVATDLSSPSTPNPTVVLPYPNLPPRTSSMKSGFFASLGRKASVSRTTAPQPLRQQPQHPTPSRSVLTKRPTISPSVPGGPRAKRISRSHTMLLSPTSTTTEILAESTATADSDFDIVTSLPDTSDAQAKT
ncbi:uncharacterized protein BT62DRAFT_917947 [Guyanagaster necrorhizus]|uniref:Uncharacterized protein n=1 Tax=Guyanagaster necrorhizus TaxID=856835 RepID=A0A9P7VYQ3_9AGAR|nr:uncharacterized protein BT62DRAFT_917947 [Guyanagaster necrorhizus MCA 3950]KAG7449387.1 hypothetical protein BT62DRAFT_917947 [Guyanagaster necrorhizus MCA 3950]